MDIELVAEGFRFPEGPIAMADGSVILTEIAEGRLTRVHPDGRKETLVETGGGPNGAAIGPDGAIYITNNGGSFQWIEQEGMLIPGPTPATHTGGSIQRYDLETGELTTLGYKRSQLTFLPRPTGRAFVFGDFDDTQISIASLGIETGLDLAAYADFDVMAGAGPGLEIRLNSVSDLYLSR